MSASAGTGADFRSHARGDSVAYKRGNAVASSERVTVIDTSPSASAAGSTSKQSREQPHQKGVPKPDKGWTRYFRLRYIVPLGLTLYLAVNWMSRRDHAASLESAILARRARLGAVGESHVLPKRWRERNVLTDDELPECKRVLLFQFTDSNGFSSDMNLFVRASVIANKLGYTLLADDSEWSFGRLQDYFLPRPIFCRPPRDWFMPSAAVPLGRSRRWHHSDRVYLSRAQAHHADAWLRAEVLDPDSMATLRAQTHDGHLLSGPGGPVAEGETVPHVLEDIYTDMAGALKDVWRLNDEMRRRVRRLRIELGLSGGEGGLRLRKHSPTWGGAKRSADQPASTEFDGAADKAIVGADSEGEEDEQIFGHGGGARSDRGPVIGVQMSPLKSRSQSEGAVNTLDRRIATVLEGVTDALARLTKSESSDRQSPSYSRSRRTASLFPQTSRASLVLFGPTSQLTTPSSNDDSKVDSYGDLGARLVRELALDSPGRNITVDKLSRPDPLTDLRPWNDLVRGIITSDLNAPGTAQHAAAKRVLAGREPWSANDWSTLPLSLRVELTKWWVRDLSVLSWFADAFIVQASSSTGRLACLLAGEDGVIGPREISGRGLGGRVRSTESIWTPSSRVASLWSDEH